MNTPRLISIFTLIIISCILTQCSSYKRSGGRTSAEREQQTITSAENTVAKFKKRDSSMKRFFNSAYGYAVFPTVGKGAVGVGGAFGKGVVFKKATIGGFKPVGFTSLSQATIGFQLGGQAYSEIIFFENARSLAHFQGGNFEFSAQASAIAATQGASADADFRQGHAVFTMPKGGLMYEASIGGQKFTYEPR